MATLVRVATDATETKKTKKWYTDSKAVSIPTDIKMKIFSQLPIHGRLWCHLTDGQQLMTLCEHDTFTDTKYFDIRGVKSNLISIVNVVYFNPFESRLVKKKSFYSFNVNTGKPTKKSSIQDDLTPELIQDLKELFNV